MARKAVSQIGWCYDKWGDDRNPNKTPYISDNNVYPSVEDRSKYTM